MNEVKFPIETPDGLLVAVSPRSDGSCYFVYRVEVPRGIRNKDSNVAEEVLIYGVPKSKVDSYLKKIGLRIERKVER